MVSRKDPRKSLTANSVFDINAWLQHICRDRLPAEQSALSDACRLACLAHRFETRVSGEPYILHIITVADILADIGMDTDVLVAALLHGMLDKTHISFNKIQQRFGTSVASLVDGAHKMSVLEEFGNERGGTPPDELNEQVRKMLRVMLKDIRVVFIKLADRLDMMRNIGYLPEEQQRYIARETLELFAPLANRMGIWQIKWELEDLSLRCVDAETYQFIAHKLADKRIDRENYIQEIVSTLSTELRKRNIVGDVTGRPKHIYSIWRKMQRKKLYFEQIFDVLAVRILLQNEDDCYRVLGIVHEKWNPVPNEFDDYIASPKNNGYRSIHTAVYGPQNRIFEAQIRTADMHSHAELGVAAHWRYKEQDIEFQESFRRRVSWVERILLMRESEESGEVLDASENTVDNLADRFRSEISEDRVYVLSPKGRVVDLPRGSTPVDFAYAIHSSLGHRCRGAKVNNRIVQLNYVLKRGDRIEVLAGKEERPGRDWLMADQGYVKTPRARARIKQWFNQRNIQQHINDGRTLLDRELRRLNITELSYDQIADKMSYQSAQDYLVALGRGDTTVSQLANIVKDQIYPELPPFPISSPRSQTQQSNDICIEGVGGLLTQTARCCNPVPYDPVIGYVTRQRGVVIHRRDCSNAVRWLDEENERLIEVSWGEAQDNSRVYPVDIKVHAYDRFGLVRDIGNIMANERINITRMQTLSNKHENIAKMVFTLEVSHFEQLRRALAKVDEMPNVINVSRLGADSAEPLF